jgi:hypothetical protein
MKDMSKNLKVFDSYVRALRYFGSNKKYSKILEAARKAANTGTLEECSKILDGLPTEDQLLDRLLEIVNKHGKGIHRTVKEIRESGGGDPLKLLKATSSLITHAVIEVERGNKEFLMIVPGLIEKCSELSYEVMK